MLGAKDIKRIRSLGQKKYRDLEGAFVVEGEKMVAEAISSGMEIRECYRMSEIGESAMARISMLTSPSPVLAVVAKKPEWESGKAIINAPGLYLALDGIRDPGNLGTILRTADWYGVSAVFASPDTVEITNPKVVQSTMGSIFRVHYYKADIPALCREAIDNGGAVYGTFMDGENIYASHLENGLDSPVVIVIGNEANGISKQTGKVVSHRITIPRFGMEGPESLNAAIATAITLSEFKRSSQCPEKE